MIAETLKEIKDFIRENNKIEGIFRKPTEEEVAEYMRFIRLERVTVADLIGFVGVYQPNAQLRLRSDLNVRVGNHIPRPGGQGVLYELDDILFAANEGTIPYRTHQHYETLHPFTDGNGRSGRMLWKWQMVKLGSRAPLGFLHSWYYQSLQYARG